MSPGRPDDSAGGLIEEILRRGEPTSAPPDDESVLLTFLFADIRGYTRFTQERGDEAAAKLTTKFALVVRDLVGQFGGTVFELRGDEAMCVFVSPRQSLRLAVALQQHFVEETAEDPDLPMTVGIGIDAGEAVRGPDGYRGGALNLAARLCARAKGGEVLASPEVTHLARTVDGLRYVTLDRVTLKGLDEPVRPVRVLPDGVDPARRLAALIAASAAPAGKHGALRLLPGPLAKRPRTTLVGAAILVAALATTAVVALRDGGTTTLTSLHENSLGIVDPHNGHLVGEVAVGAGPVAAAAGFGSVWTANTDGDSVSRVDTTTHQVTPIGVGSAPSAIAVGLGAVWVANSNSGTVTRIDPETNAPQTITVGNVPAGVAVGRGSVWVTNSRDATVSRIDPALNRQVELIDVGDTPRGISAGRDIWVANSASNSVSRINGAGDTHAAAAPINVGSSPSGIAVVGDTVWVTNTLDSNISRIPTSGTSVLETVQLGPEPAELAAVDGHVWIAMQASRRIVELAPRSRHLERSVAIGPVPGGLVAAAGKLWVTAAANPALHRGGTVHLVGEDIQSIDPTYQRGPWQGALLGSSYDALVGFRHAGGVDGTAIVPDLATGVPVPTNGGRTYIFQLRGGVRWSTGKPVTVFDVRRGIERAIAYPNTLLAAQIVGGQACHPSRCEVKGVTVDATTRTVRIDLVQPDGHLLSDMTQAYAVPADTPLAEHTSDVVAATGPYQVTSYRPGQTVVLTRNRFFHAWSAAAQPQGYPDRIEYSIDTTKNEERAIASVASGTSDTTDARFALDSGAVAARFGTRVHATPSLTMHGLFLNTRIPPFDDVRVRQALAYALDRGTVANTWPTPGSLTCQFLPPNYPGYRYHCPYTLNPGRDKPWTSPDVARAEALVKNVRKRGVTLYADDDKKAVAFRPVVAALKHLGYPTRIVIVTKRMGEYFDYVADSRHKVQAGFFGWVVGGGSPAAYFGVWACGSFSANSGLNVNPAGFCDPSIDRLRAHAEQVQSVSPAAASPLWAELDRLMVKAAPWIPLVHPLWVDVVSKRVHNFNRNPFIGVLYDQMWVR